jgi:N-acetylgalactosamine-N,N'-diacetylbacillosaminyl-diphospho-undecaprenol 4-alpha-N-acetylgalactosaminyltransferase
MISVFINSLTSGGAEKVVLTLIERFKRKDTTLELIMIERDRFYNLPEGVPAKYLTTYDSLESGPLKFPYLLICAWRLKQSIKSPEQVIQSHLLRASFINVIAKWLGSPHHAQVVIHSRVNFDHKPWPYRVFAKWLYQRIFDSADSVVSICETMKLELDDYLGLRNHPMHLAIHNPHDIKNIQEKAQEEPANFRFDSSKKYIISVGRLVEGKRIDDLIRGFSELIHEERETHLIILGDGVLRDSLEKLSINLGLGDRIHFVGFQKNPFAFVARSMILVLSSEWEGLPNIIIEAMACGTTVLSSDCISGPREILYPNSDLRKQIKDELEVGDYGILYPVGNVDLLVGGLRKLINDEELRKRLVDKGLKRAKDFDKAKIAEQYFKSFNV